MIKLEKEASLANKSSMKLIEEEVNEKNPFVGNLESCKFGRTIPGIITM